jgi:hypothetical protein
MTRTTRRSISATTPSRCRRASWKRWRRWIRSISSLIQYDIVCNGIELSSGAIRNHRPDIMYKAFEIAGYSQADVDTNFAGMINAFKYGAPPHGGSAPGIDRIVMLLADEPNIREVIALPDEPEGGGSDDGRAVAVTLKQLRELHIRIVDQPAKPLLRLRRSWRPTRADRLIPSFRPFVGMRVRSGEVSIGGVARYGP